MTGCSHECSRVRSFCIETLIKTVVKFVEHHKPSYHIGGYFCAAIIEFRNLILAHIHVASKLGTAQ